MKEVLVKTRLLVHRPDGVLVATVVPTGKTDYEIDTSDDEVRRIIEQALVSSDENGLAYHHYRRDKTATGLQYQSLARWVKRGEGDFLQALGDHLIHSDLFAYPEKTEDA